MDPKAFEQHWNVLAEDVMTGMAEWRVQHPRATFRQTHAPASWAGVETALDERLARMRARMLQDLALASTAADWEAAPEHEHPRCPQCDQPLERESKHTRHLQTQGGQDLALERRYGTCPACGAGIFPPG